MENYWKDFYKQVFNSLDKSKQLELMPVDQYLESLKYEQYFKKDWETEKSEQISALETKSLSKGSIKDSKEKRKLLKKVIKNYEEQQKELINEVLISDFSVKFPNYKKVNKAIKKAIFPSIFNTIQINSEILPKLKKI